MVGRRELTLSLPEVGLVTHAITGVGLPIGLTGKASGPRGRGVAIFLEGHGKDSFLSRTIFIVGKPNHVPSPMAGQGKRESGQWIPGVGCVDMGQLKSVPQAGKGTKMGPGKGESVATANPCFWNHMQSLLGAQLAKSQVPDFP